MALAREIVVAVGVDHRHAFRQRAADLVMVEHDHVGARRACRGDRRAAVGAAVDGDDQLGAARHQLAHRLGIGAVALEDAVGDIDLRAEPEMRQEALEERGGSRAVDIVVAEDRHPLALQHRPCEPFGGGLHVGQRGRVGQQRADRRVEEAPRLLGGDAAAGQHAGDEVGHAVALGDGERGALLALVETVLPGDAGRRAPHIEEKALLRAHFSQQLPRNRVASA